MFWYSMVFLFTEYVVAKISVDTTEKDAKVWAACPIPPLRRRHGHSHCREEKQQHRGSTTLATSGVLIGKLKPGPGSIKK
jgi:hypothetical protein